MKIERILKWTAEAEEGLCYALGDDRNIIAAAVDRGRLELYRLFDGEAYMVTRVERGKVTVCCYQGGRTREAAEWLFARVKELGLRGVRFHTKRPGLARLLKEFGFQHVEHVFEARVA